jgi:hypothetical protein
MGEATGADLIAAERRRQIEVEGWTAEHDAQHLNGELAMAAQAYIDTMRKAVAAASGRLDGELWKLAPPLAWPWDWEWWKPSDDPVRNLVKAGALIAAEIDRIVATREKTHA